MKLLPDDFDALAVTAVRRFWSSRKTKKGGMQGGTRDAVISGKNMDGFISLVRQVAIHCGLPAEAVITNRRHVILPGYFRATKNWDVLVIYKRRLIAVFEFKSQVGSFGNNFNNRSEEVIGAAADLWVAHCNGAYQDNPASPTDAMVVRESTVPLLHPDLQRDPRPPFLGWLMLLEECKGSMTPVRCDEPNYRVFPEFRGASYARRYQILCERLMERQLYSAASLVLSSSKKGVKSGTHRALSDATSLRNLFIVFAGMCGAAVQLEK
jgi:hypothetical protein